MHFQLFKAETTELIFSSQAFISATLSADKNLLTDTISVTCWLKTSSSNVLGRAHIDLLALTTPAAQWSNSSTSTGFLSASESSGYEKHFINLPSRRHQSLFHIIPSLVSLPTLRKPQKDSDKLTRLLKDARKVPHR